MAATLWSYGEVKDHWDDLMLRAHIEENGDRVLYQEGSLTELRRPNELVAAYLAERGLAPDDGLPVGTALFCGALPAIGGIRPSGRFEMTLDDPVRNERIEHGVDIKALPVIS
jgi:hypothetical protein